MLTIVDLFMVVSELLAAFLAMRFNNYSVRAQAFLITASGGLAALWLIELPTDSKNPLISYAIIILSIAILVVLHWHDFRKKCHLKKQAKVERMTNIQRKKYEREQKAKQQKKSHQRLNSDFI